MKRLLLTALLLCSCGHHVSQDTSSGFADIQAQRDAYVASFTAESITKCDRLTFTAIMESVTDGKTTLSYENPVGKWNRDTQPCYPAESSSECSLDSYLSVLHYATAHDRSIMQRMGQYLPARKWLCGEGPSGVTDISKLKGVIQAGYALAPQSDDALVGFQGNLAASYIWLQKRIRGSNTLAEIAAAKLLSADTPRNPFLSAVAGDKERTIANLRDFPTPVSQFWGSAPDDVIYVVSAYILERL